MRSKREGSNVKISLIRWTVTLAAALSLGACGQKQTAQKAAAQESRTLAVKGSDTLLQLSTMWSEALMKKDGKLDIMVTGGGSGTGIAALVEGHTDIANSSRPIKQKELDAGKAKGIDIREIIVGMDAISVIVNPSNPVSNLTMEQLKKIFTGAVTNWNQVGGPDMKIVVLSRDSSSGTHAFFKETVCHPEEYSANALFVASNSAIVSSVSTDRGAVGYVGLAHWRNALDKVKGLSVNGIMPSVETASSGAYPIARNLNVYVAGEPKGLAKIYIDFALGSEGQQIVEKIGFVPIPK